MCCLRNLFLSAQWPLFTLCEAGYPEALGNLPPPQEAGLEWQLWTFNPFCRQLGEVDWSVDIRAVRDHERHF